MTVLYGAAAALVLAQLVGIYGLVTRKADLVFSLLMVALLVVAAILAISGVEALRHP